MYNAAIIIYKRSTLPKILNFFVIPRIVQTLEVGNEENKVLVHLVQCPLTKNPADNRKLGKTLEGLLREKEASFYAIRSTDDCPEELLPYIDKGFERCDTGEIAGIKALGILIKLSVEKHTNLLKENLCFIGESFGYDYISTISEEASGVFVYDNGKMDGSARKKLFDKLMTEKGISAVFTKDMDKAIAQCGIILTDGSVGLEAHKESLTGKILIGSTDLEGNFEKADGTLLWYDSMKELGEDDICTAFNDELLALLRHIYKDKSAVDFIRRFPYIYFRRSGEREVLTNT